MKTPGKRKSLFRGVEPNGATGWAAELIAKGGVRHYLGTYTTEEEAARAFDKKALEIRGPGAKLNFPDPNNPVRHTEVLLFQTSSTPIQLLPQQASLLAYLCADGWACRSTTPTQNRVVGSASTRKAGATKCGFRPQCCVAHLV